MKLWDVNILVCAHREDAPEHSRCHRWLLDALAVETGCEWISADRGSPVTPD